MTPTVTASLPSVIIITGPTASGKTWVSEQLAEQLPIEIINADMGQFYTPLSVGTAKPDWKNKPYKSHLFDCIDQPIDVSVMMYRQQVLTVIAQIVATGKIPVIVGGSLFYIKSLLFPPLTPDVDHQPVQSINLSADDQALWDQLFAIDPTRAQALHPHDRYRVARALTLWQRTGCLPSTLMPIYNPPFNSVFIDVGMSKEQLDRQIHNRAASMIRQDGWIDEARTLINTSWEPFLHQKGLIGYDVIFDWLRNGGQEALLQDVITVITQNTRQYAKRQVVFLKKLKMQLEDGQKNAVTGPKISFYSLFDPSPEKIDALISNINKSAHFF